MSEPVELVCSRLGDVHPKSDGGYTGKCPAHEDDHDSLSIDAGEDGRALLKCFAGCDLENILAALRLTIADLFPSRNGGGGRGHISSHEWFEPSNTSQKR
jgi:putative DNA primase/helicase